MDFDYDTTVVRHAKFSLLPNQQAVDEKLSSYKYGPSSEAVVSSSLKRFLENHRSLRTALLVVVLLGACMVIGDGVLSPAISSEIVLIACVILVCLFALQHYGTHKVAFVFAPVVIIWLDLYFGQFLLLPPLQLLLEVKLLLLATFSIIKQCHALGCFPRVKVVHTSKHMFGQIYIPEINWILMILTLAITIGFQDTTLIGNAYCLACMTVMFVTTFLMALVIIFVWQKSILIATIFLLFFWVIEGVYLSAASIKVFQGGVDILNVILVVSPH
ncbi:Potassium transporter 4 [Spatholobus suberectus]|nr:Potassium transporter 4 [Spatholobus suberectus]